MNMRKKLREFFTMTRRAEEGFTLVELIVVIAIVAILGGVAVPAYSGYIEKADRAADAQLLADVNKAFAAACMVKGVDNFNRNDVTVELSDEEGGKEIARLTVDEVSDFKTVFESFYEGGAFKKTTQLKYEPAEGRFVDPDAKGDGKTKTYNFGGLKITLNADDVAILSGDNAFSDRGSEALLNDIGTLETYLANGFLDDTILGEIGASDDFMNAFAGYLGLKKEDYEDEDAYWAAYEAKLTEIESTNKNATTNALIMYAASSAGGTSTEKINNLFTYVEGEALTSRIEGSTNKETMANAALAYGMYTAYAEQNGIDTTDPSKFTQTVNTAEFATYVASPAGQADLSAYMAAMNMVSDNTSNSEITSSVLTNGIVNNSDLAALMKEVMGS